MHSQCSMNLCVGKRPHSQSWRPSLLVENLVILNLIKRSWNLLLVHARTSASSCCWNLIRVIFKVAVPFIILWGLIRAWFWFSRLSSCCRSYLRNRRFFHHATISASGFDWSLLKVANLPLCDGPRALSFVAFLAVWIVIVHNGYAVILFKESEYMPGMWFVLLHGSSCFKYLIDQNPSLIFIWNVNHPLNDIVTVLVSHYIL